MKLETIFVEYIPESIEPGKLYVSEEYGCCTHFCPCGCGTKVPIPFKDQKDDFNWGYSKGSDSLVTLDPSLLNPCRAHYHITKSEITGFRIEP